MTVGYVSMDSLVHICALYDFTIPKARFQQSIIRGNMDITTVVGRKTRVTGRISLTIGTYIND